VPAVVGSAATWNSFNESCFADDFTVAAERDQIGGDGEIVIVEIKSSVADFRADQKWMDYRPHCDRLFFATVVAVPCEIFPPDAGLIVADAFGASIVCEAPEHRLPAATRKSVMLRFAHAAALRLQALADPQGPYSGKIGERVRRKSAIWERAWRESVARCGDAC